MLLNVINLKSRADRLQSFISQANEQGFQYKVWEGIIDTPVQKGISKAHKQIIKHAKENNLEHVIIAEDDCVMVDVGAWNYFINNIPKDVDLYLGSISWGTIYQNNIVKHFSGLTLYICFERFYDKFLSSDETKHIDMNMHTLNGKYVVCNPFVAIQSKGFSNNREREVDYTKRYFNGAPHFKQRKHQTML